MKKNVLFVVLVLALVLVGCAEHEHVWDEGVVSKKASCTEAGERIYTCETCKATRTEAIPATGHSYEFEIATPATCVENGVETEVCSVCKEKSGETRTIPAAHKYNADGVCSDCGAKKDEVEKAEARIGTKYYATLTDAIKSLKEKEDKVAIINILKNSVKLEDFSNITGSKNNSTYNITFVGAGASNTTMDVNTGADMSKPAAEGSRGANYIEGAKLTFKDLTVCIGANANYQGFIRAGELTFDSCSIEGMGSYWGVGDVVFTNCEFKDNLTDYNLWLHSGNSFKFEDCTFTSSVGKFINAYKEQDVPSTVAISNCKFVGVEKKYPALFLKPGSIWTVGIEKAVCENVETGTVSGSPFYEIRLKENGVDLKTETKVSIDGTVVWENGARKNN